MLRYVNCSWYNFYNFLLNMGIKFHAHCIFYFAHFQKSCMKNGSYLIEIGSESENKWVVDFFVRSKLPGEIQCLVYTGSFLFPLSNDQYCEPTLICVRDIFASFARVSSSRIFSPQTSPVPKCGCIFFQVIFILIANIVRRKLIYFLYIAKLGRRK